MSSAPVRMYGGGRRSKGLGIGGPGTGQALIVIGAGPGPVLFVNTQGLGSLLVTLPVALTVITVAVWQRHGMPVLDLAVARIRWEWGRWRSETTYRALVLRHPRGLDLPGVLTPTVLLRVM